MNFTFMSTSLLHNFMQQQSCHEHNYVYVDLLLFTKTFDNLFQTRTGYEATFMHADTINFGAKQTSHHGDTDWFIQEENAYNS